MSCRVLGRAIETAFLGVIAADARARGATRLLGRFIPTTKNAPAATFFADHGFRELGDGRWERVLDLDAFATPHIRIDTGHT